MLLIFAFTLAGALIILLLLATFFFVWYLATKVALQIPTPNDWGAQKRFISLELDPDGVPFATGSTFTVFGATFTAVNHPPAAPNQVEIATDHNEQWENFYSALVSAVLPTQEPFTQYYSLTYGFYITITDTANRSVPAAPSGFFKNSISVYQASI